MPYNFIAFRFTDNDFHNALRQAVEYVQTHKREDLSLDAWKAYVTIATDMYSRMHSISDWSVTNRDIFRSHEAYITQYLTVLGVPRLEELENFEGYVVDRHLGNVFYYSTF